MNRRQFFAAGAAAGISPVFAACSSKCACVAKKHARLNLCLQWGGIPVQDDINAKLDFLESNGYGAVEIPSGKWVLDNGRKLADALKGRKLFLATACGPSRFDRADKAGNDKEVESFLPVLEVLGAIGSVGLIICPARGKPEVGLKELRRAFVEDYGKRLAEKAAACGTSIVLEPLQRAETPFLRQVSDGARMAQEIGKGCTVMGDFWHMSKEEASMFGAFVTAGDLLAHVHVASLRRRKIPGSDGEADNYVDGFRGLKFIGYQGAVSLEAGYVAKGKDAKGRDILPDLPERREILKRMCDLLRSQWEQA